MKTKLDRRQSALTRTDLLVLVFIILVLWQMVGIGVTTGAKRKAQRISCMNSLKEIGTAYRLWADEHGGFTPASESASRGGWSDLLTSVEQGENCWTNYAILADELGRAPKLLVCPADERVAAAQFLTNSTQHDPHISYFRNNSNLSYFRRPASVL